MSTAANLKVGAKGLMVLIGVAVALLAADLATYFVASGSLQKANADLSYKESQVENSKKIANRLDESKQKYIAVGDELKTLETGVNEAAYVPTLLKQLEHTGQGVSLAVVGVRPVAKPPEAPAAAPSREPGGSGDSSSAPPPPVAKKPARPPYDTLQVDIQVQGTYWNVMRFLDQLKVFPKIIAVDSVQMNPTDVYNRGSGSGGGRVISPRLSATLSVTAFVFPVEKLPALGAKGGPAPTITVVPVEPSPRPRPSMRVSEKNWRSGHEAG
jgi:Tfp pilus assembly protein PilO